MLVVFWMLFLVPHARAHSDPSGDTHPEVFVVEGNFVVEFGSKEWNEENAEQRSYFRMVWSPDGKLLLPRHRVLPRPEDRYISAAWPVKPAIEFREGTTKGRFFCLWHETKSGRPTAKPLPLEIESSRSIPQLEAVTVAGPALAFTWAGIDETVKDSNRVTLYLSHVMREGFLPGATVMIGMPATIYGFPTSSAPVWAAGRWWVAWVRQSEKTEDRKVPTKTWQTVLSSYDPATKKLGHKPLVGLSNWNTSLSMKTAGGWLCIAWHASVDGSYPGEAKIVTAFEKLPGK